MDFSILNFVFYIILYIVLIYIIVIVIDLLDYNFETYKKIYMLGKKEYEKQNFNKMLNLIKLQENIDNSNPSSSNDIDNGFENIVKN